MNDEKLTRAVDLAIAAVKAQALWEAADLLRQQAADLHPEFARMLEKERS